MFLAFMAFVLIWFGIGMWATTRKLPDIVAWGGGAALSLLITVGLFQLVEGYSAHQAIQTEQNRSGATVVSAAALADTDNTAGKGLGVDYDQLMTALAPFTPELKPAPTTPDGRTRMLGRTQGGSLGMLEISGKSLSQAVEKATLALSISKDDQASDLNGELLSRYLAAIYPDWNARTDWAVAAIQAGKPKTVERSGKRISFSQSAELKMFIFVSETI